MKFASSIRYGGQLIEAADVGYSDYKKLGLLCPNCKSPVFLQLESTRQLPSKNVIIPSHFKHFEVKNVDLVRACEMRVAKYDQKEIEKRQTQARNQRLKTLQRHFMTLVCKAYRMRLFNDAEIDCKNVPSGTRELILLNTQNIYEDITARKTHLFCLLKTKVNDIRGRKYANPMWQLEEEEVSVFDKLTSKIDLAMHELICTEIIEFLLSKSSHPIFSRIIKFCLYLYLVSLHSFDKGGSNNVMGNGLSDFCRQYRVDAYSRDALYLSTVDQLSIILVSVPWADEFAITG